MNVVSVDDILNENGFLPPELSALVPDRANYKALLLQPEGYITADSRGVHNTNTVQAQKQFHGFLSAACDTDADLVVTPEYSLPWSVLRSFLEDGNGPNIGKLWVLGSESIALDELKAFETQLADKATFIYESVEPNGDRFLNPLVYVFRAPAQDDETTHQLVVLVQFKTYPLGDHDNFEVNGMLPGSRLYYFGGSDSQIRLLTLICSDAFAFSDDLATRLYDRALVLHIQLNPNPRQSLFRSYRSNLLKFAGDTEIITLNWAKDVNANVCASTSCWGNIAGSGWYLRPDKLRTDDSFIQHNHNLGLYYTRLHVDRCHALFFSYEPAAYLVTATKVVHLGVQAPLSTRCGPKMEKLYRWSENENCWESGDAADDGFSSISSDAGEASAPLELLASTNAMAVERILAICAGHSITAVNWYHATYLDSCRIDADEVVKRVTFCHDQAGSATHFRKTRLIAGRRTYRLLQGSLPPSLSDFSGGFQFDWTSASPHTNSVSDEGRRATAIALDDNHSLNDAERIRSTMAEYLRKSAPSYDESLESMQRLHVWYRDVQGNQVLCDPYRYVRYDQTVESPFDIGRTS